MSRTEAERLPSHTLAIKDSQEGDGVDEELRQMKSKTTTNKTNSLKFRSNKEIYKSSYFDNFHRELEQKEIERIDNTSIFCLNEVISNSNEPKMYNLSLKKELVQSLKSALRHFISNNNLYKILNLVGAHLDKQIKFTEGYIKACKSQLEFERNYIKNFNSAKETENSKLIQETIRSEVDQIKIEMEKRHGIEEERNTIMRKKYLLLNLAIQHKEIDFWIPLYSQLLKNYNSDYYEKIIQNFIAKFNSKKEELNKLHNEKANLNLILEDNTTTPIHEKININNVYLEIGIKLDEDYRRLFEKYQIILNDIFKLITEITNVYFSVFSLKRLRLDKEKAIQNDIDRISIMNYEDKLIEKSNFWFQQFELRKSNLNRLYENEIQALINQQQLLLNRLTDARINKLEREVKELQREVEGLKSRMSNLESQLQSINSQKLDPKNLAIKFGTKLLGKLISSFLPGMDVILDAVVDAIIPCPPPDVGEEEEEETTYGIIFRFLKKGCQWGYEKLFGRSEEGESEGRVDLNNMYDLNKIKSSKVPSDIILKLKSTEVLDKLSNLTQTYSTLIQQNIALEYQLMQEAKVKYDEFNGLLCKMYNADYMSRLYKNRQTMENFYYYQILDESDVYKKTNLINFINFSSSFFDSKFMDSFHLDYKKIDEFIYNNNQISPTGCCRKMSYSLFGISALIFFQNLIVKKEQIYHLAAKKIRKRLGVPNKCCMNTIDRLKNFLFSDFLSLICSKEFWSSSKDCLINISFQVFTGYNSKKGESTGRADKKFFVDYNLNILAVNFKNYVFENLLKNSYNF